MQDLTWIDAALCRWGRLLKKEEVGGIGFPRTSPMFKERIGGHGWHDGEFLSAVELAADDAGDEFKRCNAGVMSFVDEALPIDARRPELVRTAWEIYVVGGKRNRMAAELSICTKQLGRRQDIIIERVAIEFGIFVA